MKTKVEMEQLFDRARTLQGACWDALSALEGALGTEIDGTRDLSKIKLEDLIQEQTKTIVAGWNGQKVVVAGGLCTLFKANYVTAGWDVVAEATYPMSREAAEEWVCGWNAVDRWPAIHYLTGGM